MLRQDPVECLFQFICSSNNHISRIHGMVERLCSAYGTPLVPTAKEVELVDGIKAATDPVSLLGACCWGLFYLTRNVVEEDQTHACCWDRRACLIRDQSKQARAFLGATRAEVISAMLCADGLLCISYPRAAHYSDRGQPTGSRIWLQVSDITPGAACTAH